MNLSVKTKVGIIVGVLAATVLAVAVVGARQLDRVTDRTQVLVDDLGQAAALNSSLRIALLNTVRLEKVTSLVNDEVRAADFARMAQESAKQTEDLLKALSDELKQSGDDDLREPVEKFRGTWLTYQESMTKVLDLAKSNTNVKARRILKANVEPAIDELVGFFSRSGRILSSRPANGGEAARQELDVLDAGLNAKDIVILLRQHINAADDAEMNQFDERLREAFDRLDADLQEVKPALDAVGQAEATRLIVELKKLRDSVTEAQHLSRANSNLKAVERSVNTNFKLSSEGNAELAGLASELEERMNAEKQASGDDYQWGLIALAGASIVGILVGGALALLISRSIVIPLIKGVELAKAIAAGDLTQRLKLDQRDEVGQLTDAMDHAAESFARIVFEIHKLSDQIGAAATDLSQVSHGLLAQSEQMSIQASNVAGGAEQMTGNINTMAAAAEEMSMNVASISSASEQISVNVGTISSTAQSTAENVQTVSAAVQTATASFHHVAQEARQSAAVTSQASDLAHQATGKMQALDRAAHEISKVTEMIKLIAMQTNLLALNATIEATSAGEAGKGFAVVADEIKELAGQSGKAAQDIAHMIEGIQTSTREAVGVIDQVAETITTINTASGRISAAVEQQSLVAQQSAGNLDAASKGVGHIAQSIAEVAKGASDMSRNAGDASHAAGDVAHNASEAARAVRDIASNIHGVSGSAKDATTGAQQVNSAASSMQQISSRLDRLVQQFRVRCDLMK